MTQSPSPGSVFVICGPQGVGKTTIATALARRLNVPQCAADDLVVAVRATTDPRDYPLLHYRTSLPGLDHGHDRFADVRMGIAEELRPAFAAVIGMRVGRRESAVLEGDYLLPPRPGEQDPHVRHVVLVEDDVDRIAGNFLAREPDAPRQGARARTSREVGLRLRVLAEEVGVPVVSAAPRDNCLGRVERALRL